MGAFQGHFGPHRYTEAAGDHTDTILEELEGVLTRFNAQTKPVINLMDHCGELVGLNRR